MAVEHGGENRQFSLEHANESHDTTEGIIQPTIGQHTGPLSSSKHPYQALPVVRPLCGKGNKERLLQNPLLQLPAISRTITIADNDEFPEQRI